jgi:membrane fusion protein (multidrug efflux system)
MSTPMSALDTAAVVQKNRRRGFMLRILILIVLLSAIVFGVWYYFEARWYESTDDAYINGNVVQITPQIAGTVVSIGADDGNLVRQGDVLVKLDRADADVALQQAAANLGNTVRKVRGLYSIVSGARADVAVREIALQKARADYDRRRDLASSGAAKNALTSGEEQLQTNKVLVDDTVVASHPDVQAATARYGAAYLDDVRTVIVAPVTGYVAKRVVQVGQRVAPGAALMAVVPLREVWVDANFKETQLTHMRIDQPVTITSDVYGNAVTYNGKVLELGVGTGSAFSLLPAQNATGNWIKIVQRVPVRVVFTEPTQIGVHPLRVGMSLNVKVNLHDESGPMLAQESPSQAAFSTDVYQQQLNESDALIAQIIHTNMAGSVK